MSIILNIKPELERQLLEITSKSGIDLSNYINNIIEKNLKEKAEREIILLQKINLGISEKSWKRYYQLIDKRNDLTLSELEQLELINISNKIEEANAKRLIFLLELADLRAVDLDELINYLGLKVPAYV